MKKYIGLAAFFGFTLTLIWGIKLFAPKPQPPTKGIPHNYYHPNVWGPDTINQDTIQIEDDIELEEEVLLVIKQQDVVIVL